MSNLIIKDSGAQKLELSNVFFIWVFLLSFCSNLVFKIQPCNDFTYTKNYLKTSRIVTANNVTCFKLVVLSLPDACLKYVVMFKLRIMYNCKSLI